MCGTERKYPLGLAPWHVALFTMLLLRASSHDGIVEKLYKMSQLIRMKMCALLIYNTIYMANIITVIKQGE